MSSNNVVLCTASYDHSIRFWQATSAQCHHSIQHNDSQVNHLKISPDKQWLAASGNPNVRLYDINASSLSHSPVRSLEGHSSNVTSAEFHKENKWIFSCGEDGKLKIWDIRAPACQIEYNNISPINAATLHPNQVEIVLVDEDGVMTFWDLFTTKRKNSIIPEGKIPLRSVSISRDGFVIAAGNNAGNGFIWEYGSLSSDLTIRNHINAHKKYLLQCVLSPNCKQLATTSADRTVKIWQIDSGSCTLFTTLSGHDRWVWDCAFSADSAYLVTACSDKRARLWDLNSGQTVLEYRGHAKAVSSVALHDLTAVQN